MLARTAAIAGSIILAALPLSQAQSPTRDSACNVASASPVVTVVPGNPFQALPTADGCWVFVSLGQQAAGGQTAIGLLRRSGGTLPFVRSVPIDAPPAGMALTRDETLLVVTGGTRLAFVDARRLIAGEANAVLGYLDVPGIQGRVYTNITKDDRFAFVADEFSESISVIDLAAVKVQIPRFARDDGKAVRDDKPRVISPSVVVGRIPSGELPIALTFSPDEKLMYSTSQRVPKALGWPAQCARDGPDSTRSAPAGGIQVIDVERAKRDPSNATLGWVRAGCIPVRLVLSPAGDRAYVSARRDNELLVFDTGKFLKDSAHALLGHVPVGSSPVGVAVADGGRRVVVTNSNRFGGSSDDRQFLSIVDPSRATDGAAAVVGQIPAGAFPRELRVTTDGKTLILTNFGSKSVQMIDLSTALRPVASP